MTVIADLLTLPPEPTEPKVLEILGQLRCLARIDEKEQKRCIFGPGRQIATRHGSRQVITWHDVRCIEEEILLLLAQRLATGALPFAANDLQIVMDTVHARTPGLAIDEESLATLKLCVEGALGLHKAVLSTEGYDSTNAFPVRVQAMSAVCRQRGITPAKLARSRAARTEFYRHTLTARDWSRYALFAAGANIRVPHLDRFATNLWRPDEKVFSELLGILIASISWLVERDPLAAELVKLTHDQWVRRGRQIFGSAYRYPY